VPTGWGTFWFKACSKMTRHEVEVYSHRPISVASQEIVLALFNVLAGTINWFGRTPPDPPGSRKEALGRNILHNITVTLEAFTTR
jgi:hypothetical protein